MKLVKQFLSRSSPWCSALPSSPSRFWLVPFVSLFIHFSGLLLEFWTLDEWFGHGQQCWKLPTLCKLQIPQVCSKRLGGRATRIKGKSHPARTKDSNLSLLQWGYRYQIYLFFNFISYKNLQEILLVGQVKNKTGKRPNIMDDTNWRLGMGMGCSPVCCLTILPLRRKISYQKVLSN